LARRRGREQTGACRGSPLRPTPARQEDDRRDRGLEGRGLHPRSRSI